MVQIVKIEQFFIMLSMVIDEIILVCVVEFMIEMGKVGWCVKVNGWFKVDDLLKQIIYIVMLQFKGYFLVL